MLEPSSSFNPYAAPASRDLTSEADEPLRFDGVITEAGYRNLLPLGHEQVLAWVLLLLLPVAAMPLMAMWGYSVFKVQNWSLTGTLIIFSLLWCGTLYGAIWLVKPETRSQRYLKANPDLLGIARGCLDENGLTFYDGNVTHWFSWPALAKLKAKPQGIRVPTDDDPNRYLALTADLFSAYSPAYVWAMTQRFASGALSQEELAQRAARVFDQTVDDERFFSGWVNYVVPCNAKVRLQLFLLEAIGSVILVFSWVALPRSLSQSVLVGVLLLTIISFYAYQYFRGERRGTMYVCGWLKADRLIYVSGHTAIELSLAQLHDVRLDQATITVRYSGRCQITIFAEHFRDPAIWQSINDQLGKQLRTNAS